MVDSLAKLEGQRICRPSGANQKWVDPDPTVNTVGYTLPRLRRSRTAGSKSREATTACSCGCQPADDGKLRGVNPQARGMGAVMLLTIGDS